MDFWSRLIAGTSLSPAGANKASSNNPDKRLARFKREYNQLIQIWRNVTNLARDLDAADGIRVCLHGLTSTLMDESRLPSPHPCLSFAAQHQIFVPMGKIATTSYNEYIIREAVGFFSTLIDSEEEDFLESEAFSHSLMNLLVRITGANSIRLNSDTEVEVVELAFGIAAKIRLQPEILPAWFTTNDGSSEDDDQNHHEKFAGKTHKEDFPLFYLLIDYIHHEGRIGDFARTGLLYIIESASTSIPLEQWLVESDLATLMATGLGALYSQLSRKLVIDYPIDTLPTVLIFSDYRHHLTTSDIVSSASLDFQGHMDTFLSHLVFWQDVLDHCKSLEVKQTLLEHFQVIFLQQLLYPSLLESSDVDGGSSVAVLTYLRRILESVEHPDMIHLILHYLLALPDIAPVRSAGPRAVSEARKRKSMDLATMLAAQAEQQSTPDLFNLVDLIIGSLRSRNEQTISVTLQLFSVILRRHHRYAVTTLLRTTRVLTDGATRTIGAHEKEIEFFLSLAAEIGVNMNFDDSYENHVKDTMSLLESHPCSHSLIAPKTTLAGSKLPGKQASIPGAPQPVHHHTLRQDDPVLTNLLHVLSAFFTNSIETNLALTEAIVDLAICGFMNIEGWLVPDSSKYTYPTESSPPSSPTTPRPLALPFSTETSTAILEAAQLRALALARRAPTFVLPPLLLTLRTLVSQIHAYSTTIPRFPDLLLQRRYQLQFQPPPKEPPLPALPARPNRTSMDSSSSRGDSPASGSISNREKVASTLDSLAQRIFPELATPSRSSSPRGRRSQDRERKRRSGGGGYGIGTPSGVSIGTSRHPAAPAQFPMLGQGLDGGGIGVGTPSRGPPRAFSSSLLRDVVPGAGDVSLGSQAAAFAEIDQGILARRVAVPKITFSDSSTEGKIEAIPFPDLRGEGGATSSVGGGVGEEIGDGNTTPTGSKDGEKGEEGGAGATDEDAEDEKTVTVSHVLTNVVILQEFLVELATLLQCRAGLFGEVTFV